MKALTQYIKESLLDDADEVVKRIGLPENLCDACREFENMIINEI